MRDRNANSTAGDEGKGKKKDDSASGESEIAVLDLALIKTDPDKLYPVIYYALKRVLKEWGESMAERPGKSFHSPGLSLVPSLTRPPSEHVKRTRQGMLAAATQVQSAEYLKPLFKLIRSRVCLCLASEFCSPYRALTAATLLSHSQTSCCLVWQRSYIICKSVSINERTMPISVCRSAMPLGRLESPWLGRSTFCPWRDLRAS